MLLFVPRLLCCTTAHCNTACKSLVAIKALRGALFHFKNILSPHLKVKTLAMICFDVLPQLNRFCTAKNETSHSFVSVPLPNSKLRLAGKTECERDARARSSSVPGASPLLSSPLPKVPLARLILPLPFSFWASASPASPRARAHVRCATHRIERNRCSRSTRRSPFR